MIADERGSIVAVNGASTTINTYDEYGMPGSSNAGRFQYTGQMWLGEAQLYHYKARAYLPQLGRFAQADPIGFAGGMNLYAYVGNDPVNATDPWGLQAIRCVPGSRGLDCTSEEVSWSGKPPRSPTLIQVTPRDVGRGGRGGRGRGDGVSSEPAQRGVEFSVFKPCPVWDAELSSGLQIGGQFRMFGVGLGGRADLWSVRLRASSQRATSNPRFTARQSTELAGSLLLGSGSVSRQSTLSEPGYHGALDNIARHFDTSPDIRSEVFTGIDLGAQLGFGVRGRYGFVWVGENETCPDS